MNELRAIRQEEKNLIEFLLLHSNIDSNHLVINELVDDYEGGKMGSIGLGKPEAVYKDDIIQVEYVDADGTDVVITLTQDIDSQILDLDFWKLDFSKLIEYPKPDKIVFKIK
jgi:hypothetical protein